MGVLNSSIPSTYFVNHNSLGDLYIYLIKVVFYIFFHKNLKAMFLKYLALDNEEVKIVVVKAYIETERERERNRERGR